MLPGLVSQPSLEGDTSISLLENTFKRRGQALEEVGEVSDLWI
jgi:hypothetical protein